MVLKAVEFRGRKRVDSSDVYHWLVGINENGSPLVRAWLSLCVENVIIGAWLVKWR